VRQQREELAHVLRVTTLGELAGSAHEITQPLSAIVTNAQAIRRLMDVGPAEEAAVRKALADMADDAKRASQIIRRLRALFRKEHADRREIDVNALIKDVVDLLRNDFQRKRIAIRCVFDTTLPTIPGDPVQLQQVMLNLLVNACEAIAATGENAREIAIEISERAPGVVAVAVRETGIGVKDGELERIFEHFVTSKPNGLGMGLAISRSIIRAHGGSIWATANADRGLAIHVELPCDRPPDGAP
jgi:two-component system, LuxR family, sensor kinase FixL